VVWRISEAAPVTGDEVRNIWFSDNPRAKGYDRSEVDDLLRRVAAELDAGQPAGPLIENATFRIRASKECDIDAVDWFMGQLLGRPGQPEPTASSADPWQEAGAVAQFTHDGSRDLAQLSQRALRKLFAEECKNAWHGFGLLPGAQLQWKHRGIARKELYREEQTLASVRTSWGKETVSAGGRTFTWRTSRASSSLPGVTGISNRSSLDYDGHFAPGRRTWPRSEAGVRGLVDEAGIPILYTSGKNYDGRACARISFPDGRWLRFLVRGTRWGYAIMTAVDQAGNKIARYRAHQITVHPDQNLTDELILAIAVSTPWLASYFDTSNDGD
jgi:DivIVA domain-containing protein